ncbi:hypothetical protein H112_01066 [Trichophyton rubrum D6]|uniref:Uncharacterized protein n=3 Tax=Trichophyton TaxID=5550 RepID=A0A080WJ64_TRIRC|nr:uncharacterized protein TERG_12554 [Trichophyton rubrum CBS 118892]EZF26887.1 hypothetical protein H100_01066 [Trichophyton rubrum MR850]EZF45884.1 hypothetical protein H102_01056 [Trichophyton rubrum CBS 100081]EZF56559.1 hypothetical protein H103_01064 [Trichophyton rubrum CBS 288.86]EZF67185.1 hypothetical protein H104_01049 [Trichophyton rubrum CBS 289.86]EZF77787.1 hypothetical protein H105_01068 [Trichophyton soudanense CBS 452.61]EZF88464.1 hypothetical protein H110_01066 [Trichophy
MLIRFQRSFHLHCTYARVVFIFPEGTSAVKYLWSGVPYYFSQEHTPSSTTSLVSVLSTFRSIWLSVKFQVGPATLGVTSLDRGSSSKPEERARLRLASRVKGPVAVKKPLSMSLFRRFLPQAKKCLYYRLPPSLSSRAP